MRGGLRVFVALLLALPGCMQEAPADATGDDHEAATALDVATHPGTWPLETVLTLSGGNSTAAEWTLDIDGAILEQGTTLPATLSHVFTQARTYNLTLTVTDGETLSVATATVDALEAAAASGITQEQPVSWVVGYMGEPNQPCSQVPPVEDADGITFDRFDVDPRTPGLPFTLEVRYSPASVLGHYSAVMFFDSAGMRLAYDYSVDHYGDWTSWHGLIPDGSVTAIAYSCTHENMEGFYRAGVEA